MHLEHPQMQARMQRIEGRKNNLALYGKRTINESWHLGNELLGAREELEHGQWLPFLRHVRISQPTAHRLITLRRRYDSVNDVRSFEHVQQALLALTEAEPEPETKPEPEAEPEPATASVRIDDGEEVKVDVEPPVKLNDNDYQGLETGEAPPIQEKPGLSASEKAIVERQELEMEIASLRQSVEGLTHTNSTLQIQVDAIGDADRPQLEDGVAQIAEVRAELEQCVAARHTLANQLKDTKKKLADAKRFRTNDRKRHEKETANLQEEFEALASDRLGLIQRLDAQAIKGDSG